MLELVINGAAAASLNTGWHDRAAAAPALAPERTGGVALADFTRVRELHAEALLRGDGPPLIHGGGSGGVPPSHVDCMLATARGWQVELLKAPPELEFGGSHQLRLCILAPREDDRIALSVETRQGRRALADIFDKASRILAAAPARHETAGAAAELLVEEAASCGVTLRYQVIQRYSRSSLVLRTRHMSEPAQSQLR
jgi:hypothetical protein